MAKPKSTYSQVKYKKDGTVKKYGAISEKKFDRKSDRYSKQKGSKSLGTNTSKSQQVVAGKGKRKSVSRTTAPARRAGAGMVAKKGTVKRTAMAARKAPSSKSAAAKIAAKKAAAKRKKSSSAADRYTSAKL